MEACKIKEKLEAFYCHNFVLFAAFEESTYARHYCMLHTGHLHPMMKLFPS